MYCPEHAKTFKQIIAQLQQSKVAVIGHMRPDGDCVGSQVALCRVLNQLGITSVAINADPVPHTLRPFIGDTPWSEPQGYAGDTHVAIHVDCADELRCGSTMRDAFPQAKVNIDHHLSNTGYAEWNLIAAQASATAEILAGIFLDLALPIDAVTAQALYVGIATDTGQFRFPSTSPQVFKICSALIERGANPSAAAHTLYENQSFHRMELLQRFLNSLRLECEGRVCIGQLSEADYSQAHAQREDAEGFVDYARSVAGVEIGIIMEERNAGVKCSLRAKDPRLRVDKLAQAFGGGGHACAAGLSQASATLGTFYATLLCAVEVHLTSIMGSMPSDT